MDFHFIHLYYSGDSLANLNVQAIASEISELFPTCAVDIRPQFFKYWNSMVNIELARISDPKQPFEKQPKHHFDNNDSMIPLYDGFILQRQFADIISDKERHLDHIHLIFTNLMICTFDEDDDWRYHGRTVICGMPSIISSTGIVEAPAKPREFYLAQYGGFADINSLKKQFAGKFIDYDDDKKLTAAATGCALQSAFFYITDGMPFCKNKACRLFNAHWQEDLVRVQIQSPRLCSKHQRLLNKFKRG